MSRAEREKGVYVVELFGARGVLVRTQWFPAEGGLSWRPQVPYHGSVTALEVRYVPPKGRGR